MREREDLKDFLLREVELIKNKLTQKDIKKMRLGLLESIVIKADELSVECNDCKEFLNYLEGFVTEFSNKSELDANIFKEYNLKLKAIITHLNKRHKLVTEGFYVAIYMPLGMSMGVAMGVVFDNIAIGISLGMAIGLVIGSAMDSDAKKKNLTI